MRMLDSMLCIPQPVFLEKHGERPDLYGPFWISTTIVFLIAVVSNYIGWYNHGAKSGEAASAWKYDTDKVTYAGILFYGYVGVIGFAIWATLRWFKAPTSLAQIWCVYGTYRPLEATQHQHHHHQATAWPSSSRCPSSAPSPAPSPAGCWSAYPRWPLDCLSCSTCAWWCLSTQEQSMLWQCAAFVWR